jgi:hypothetical protein
MVLTHSERTVLVASDWVPLTSASRREFKDMSQEYPDKPRYFKLQRNYHVVLVCLVNTLMGIPDCLSQSEVSQLLRVLPFFIDDTATEDFTKFFASLTAQMYGRFVLESKFGGRGSPMAIFLDSE